MPKREKTDYPGIYFRWVKRRGKKGDEKVYYIVFKKDGKVYEEKVGRQFVDGMTPAKAVRIRGERIEGKRKSRVEIKKEILNKWTFERLWNKYKEMNPNNKGLQQDENRYKLYIGPNFGIKEPKDLSPFDVDKLRINLSKLKKLSTVKNVLELLRRLINFGEMKQLCEGIDFKITMPIVNNEKTEDLTPEQLDHLLDVIETHDDVQAANLMKLILFTGMRRGEAFRLKWQNIDFKNGFLKIVDPKGGIDQKIPLNDQAIKILTSHPKSKSDYVFPGRGGKQRTDINHQVKKIKEKAELPKDFRALHGLRHVYASMLASSGKVEMYTLQKLLTHKSPQMTQRYAHLRDEALKNASQLAGELLEKNIDKKMNTIKVESV